jgi:hypothetical protein
VSGHTVYRERIPEIVVPGKPLGRHIHFDSRSAAYPWQRRGADLTSRIWPRHGTILNQGQVGSCTGNAEVGALECDPLFSALSAVQQATLNETGALSLYSAAETIDGSGAYPPVDNGSSGTSVSQAALNAGLISGYLHPASVTDMADALQTGPVIVGVNWYDSFDTPDATGLILVAAGAQVRGGHEFLVRGVDVTAETFEADNSWGLSYGLAGSMRLSWDTMTRLFAEQGDCVAPLALSVPVPVPQPVPVPVPVPPGPDANAADVALARAVTGWAHEHHAGQNRTAATAVRTWLEIKGFVAS